MGAPVSPWHEAEAGVPDVAPAAVGGEAVVELVGGGGAVGGVAVVARRQVHVLPHLLAVLARPGGGMMISAVDDQSVSQSVFTITEKAPTMY